MSDGRPHSESTARERWRERLDPRVSLGVAAGMVIGVSMVLLGMRPRLVLVGLIFLLVALTAALIADLRTATSPLALRDHRAVSGTTARPDRRVQTLRTRLRTNDRIQPAATRESVEEEHTDEVTRSLIEAIDDRLVEEHGIDRHINPEAAGAVLGPELTRFLTDPAARRSMMRRRSLASTLSLIESL